MDGVNAEENVTSNLINNRNEPLNITGFSPQLTGSVYFSFPPPPCAPSALDPHQITANVVYQAPSQVNSTVNIISESGAQGPNGEIKRNDEVTEVTNTFSNCLNLSENNPHPTTAECTMRPSSAVEYAPAPYSVILPPGSFLHHFGGSVPPPLYHQFSPVLPATISQLHPVYPINVLPTREPLENNPTVVPVAPPPISECTIQAMHPHSSAAVVGCASNATDTWTGQSASVTSNPSVFWGHYMGTDKGLTFASQSFMRRHSIVDDSSVVTPTNVCPPCNLAGIVSATPEFIHPRKPDVPQWLMSPPVGEQDPSIISYAPMLYHNVRVPSVTGIAIPIVGPVGAAVPISNPVTNIEPAKVDPHAVVVSPVPCFEGPPLPPPVPIQSNSVEVQLQNCGEKCDVFCESGKHPKDVAPPITATNIIPFGQQTVLLTPSDFSSSTSQSDKRKKISKPCKLLSPSDFDAGYDPAEHRLIKMHPVKLLKQDSKPGTSKTDKLEGLRNSSRLKQRKEQLKRVVVDDAIIANLKMASRKYHSGNVTVRNNKTKTVESDKEVSKSCSCSGKRKEVSELLYTFLLNAAVNLSVASGIMLSRKDVACTKHCLCHIKHGFSSTRCKFGKGWACSRKLQHIPGTAALKSAELPQTQCWQCEVNDKGPDVKRPTPDLFNRWPNIPPPPAPPTEEEDCQGVCGATQIAVDALPLAAALFHNEPTDCCQGNGFHQEEEPQIPPTYPIGVFWDIENCAVPTGKSSLSIVQRVRERFFAGHKEAEFMCVCDINKESRHVIQDLNNAQVNVVHINATAKNAADDKLRQSIRRFAHNHPAPATLVLITGDSNFTSEVSDLRHRHKYFVVLIHPACASPSLLQAATTVICYEQLVADLPVVHVSPKASTESPQPQLLVSNLPLNNDANAVRTRLRQLSDNCGGKVVKLSMGTAVLKFATPDAANRALKRLEGEDVFGHAITVSVLKQSPDKCSFIRNGKHFSNPPNFSPGRKKMGPQSGAASESFRHPIPGHCNSSGSFRPAFQQPPFPPMAPPSIGLPPFPPMIPPPHPGYNPTGPSPNMPQNGYNSLPPPPQPQVFQPLDPNKKENQDCGVKLTISNIDAQLGALSIQEIFLKQISEYCQVLDMKVRPHNRFTVVCDVTVPHVRDASRVLQNLQRQKIGTKRVLVTLAQQNWDEFGVEEAICFKRDCFALLKENGGKRMPLYRFFDLYEKRFQHRVKLEELRQIPDVVLFYDGSAGREIYLNPKIKDEQTLEQHIASYPHSGRSTPDINHDFLLPVCKLHYPADAPRPPSGEKGGSLLKIEMGLREFSAKLHALLHSHNGILQLDGFEYCYCAEYGTFPFPSNVDEGGVIVEHQASYVPGVQIITSQPHCLGVKAIVWAQPQSDTGSDTASDTSGASRWKSPNLIHFSREVVDLLKDKPYCCLPYENFSSAYQRHFGNPCRPSEYGFTRLSDLLAAIPHVLQIMGSLSNRILTLTHRAQVKRFTQEVMKILKSTPDRAILVAQMPELYNRTFHRAWRLRDYGVSVLSDLLDDIPEGHICTTGEGDNIVLSLPIRERTAEEKERTNHFAREVVKILRTRPHYRMPFTEFVPTYHRQFGRQCKLANYGFSKLIDLFEALPHVVLVVEKGTDKLLSLTDTEQQKILSIQITSILRAQIPPAVPAMSCHDTARKNDSEGPTLPLACIPALFQQKYGFPLVPQELNATDLDDLVKKLSHAIKVVVNQAGDKMVRLAERKPLRLLSAQLLALLLDQSADQLDVDQLHSMYAERYKENIDPAEYGFLSFSDIIRKALPGVVKMDLDAPECLIHLKSLYKEARAIRSVLLKNNGTMTIGEFNFAYLTTFQGTVDYEKQGFPTFEALLRALPNVLIVKGFGAKRTLTLRNHMQFGPLTAASMGDNATENALCGSASLDDLQALDGSHPRHNIWAPKVPRCMMPHWTSGRRTKQMVNSVSLGDFRAKREKCNREKVAPIIGRPAPNWIRPAQQMSSTQLPASCEYKRLKAKQTAKIQSDDTKGGKYRSATDACTFTIGETSSTHRDEKTPVRRGVSVSVITLPSGSTPIASTSSCSSESTPKSTRSSGSENYSEDSCSSEENSPTRSVTLKDEFPSLKRTGVSSLPSSPFARITATAYVGALPSMRNHHSVSDHGSPGRMQLAASFPTLTQS